MGQLQNYTRNTLDCNQSNVYTPRTLNANTANPITATTTATNIQLKIRYIYLMQDEL